MPPPPWARMARRRSATTAHACPPWDDETTGEPIPTSWPRATPVRACASRRSWATAWAAVPAIAAPGAADQAATDDGGAGQRQPELDDQPPAFGAPAQLAVLVGPGVGALDHPAAARLDRGWQPAGGDLAHHATL